MGDLRCSLGPARLSLCRVARSGQAVCRHGFTVSVVVPGVAKPFILAEIVTLPTLTPVASPLFFFGTLTIVAIALFEDDQVRLGELVRFCVDPSA